VDEDALFEQAMRGVRKLRVETRAGSHRPGPRAPVAPKAAGKPSFPAVVDRGPEATASWVLKDPGVSRERLRRLAAGQPPVDVELDLHGMSREKAWAALGACMCNALSDGLRVLCLIHGRGMHSSDGKPVLKKAVYEWLREGPYAGQVLAVIPRPGTAGGACLVLLRRIRRR